MASQAKTGQQGGNGSAYASKSAIMLMQDLPHEELSIPEWNNMVVRVRQLTGTERGIFEGAIAKVNPDGGTEGVQVKMDPSRMKITLVALTMIDEKGKRIFGDREVDALGTKSARAIERIYEVSARLSGLTNESMEETSDLSSAAQRSDSISDSASS